MAEIESPEVTPAPEEPKSAEPVRRSFFGRFDGAKSPSEALQPEAAPPPPPPRKKKRRGGILSTTSGFLSFCLVLMAFAMFGYGEFIRALRAPGPLAEDKAVVVAPGSDGAQIVDQLVNEGVVSNGLMFTIGMRLESQNTKTLKAGEYLFKQYASLQDVIDTLANGRVILHNLTVPEGWTSEQAVERLRENDLLSGDIKDVPPEGSIFPDTYRFSKGSSRSMILRQMEEAEKKVVAEVWAKRASDLPLKTPYEMVTLASIVERETAKADERARIAGVYLNRLQKHMRLQSDPTIVYGLVGGKGTLGHPILKSELEKPTPYNTYLVDGLPPGPIGNPGRASLEAVANPSRTKELYFVADGSGGHVFSETLEQHLKNVARWRQIENDMKDKVAPDLVLPQGKPGSQGFNDMGAKVILVADAQDDDLVRQARARLAASLREKGQNSNAFGGLGGPVVEDGTGAGTAGQGAVRTPAAGTESGGAINTAKDDQSTNGIIKYRVLDASEGTALDPLRLKDYDLNSPKSVPKLN